FSEALNQLEKAAKANKLGLGSIIACSRLGAKDSRIYYEKLEDLRKIKGSIIKAPFCLVLPGRLHFIEDEALGLLAGKI
ncbi:hypothetical protein HYT92_02120, partial [Candidatus Pacearchaeota archaeon]|nr:hypothetical protein [Candidatus Pacearchaeota archaeon]